MLKPVGPMLNGATNIVFEGVPTHPTPSRCWEVVEKYKVKPFLKQSTVRLLLLTKCLTPRLNATSVFSLLGDMPFLTAASLSPQVKQFYTAPTALRSLMRSGDEWVKACDRSSLKV
jgi:acetyl-CoA synthetase